MKCRIIFLTPFLIIQDQLQVNLKNSGYEIDFILNGGTIDKSIKPSYTIISSTYHSFYHISDELTNNNFVIVDEAHSFITTEKKIENVFIFTKLLLNYIVLRQK